jgi:DNA-binding NarL/FixJ family response regulator
MLVDSETMFTGLMKGLLQATGKEPGSTQSLSFDILGVEGEGYSAWKAIEHHKPNLVLIEPFLISGLSGLDIIKRTITTITNVKILVLSSRTKDSHVRQVFCAGAGGIIFKEQPLDQLFFAISQVMKGHRYLDPKLTRNVIGTFLANTADTDTGVFAILTERQREVLKLVTEGATSKQTASAMGVSVKTVLTHRENIMNKLNLHSVAELTRYAVSQGLIQS